MHTHTLQAKGSAEPTHQDHDARQDAGFNNPLRQAARDLPSANRELTSERLHLRPLNDVVLVSAAFAGVWYLSDICSHIARLVLDVACIK